MNCNILAGFRKRIYGCFRRASDALMDALDALSTDTAARSFIELSLSAFFRRNWPSLYAAFKDGMIDRPAMQKVFCAYAPIPQQGERLVIGVDASSIPRPESPTARDRTYVHVPNMPEGVTPVVPGWQFSTLSVLPKQTSSWTYVLDNRRVPSDKTQGEIAAEQLKEVVALLPVRPLLEGDSYYGSVAFLLLTADIACDKLARLPSNRVLYRPAPPKTGKRGAPRKDGDVFRLGDPKTHGQPDEHAERPDEAGKRIEVDCWSNLHFKRARHIRVSVLRVTRHGAQGTKRDPRVSWFEYVGEGTTPVEEVPTYYGRRYSLEHAYRVDKQDLFWASARLRTPEQMQVWTDIVACARNQLNLSRQLGDARQPWENKSRPATPQQVRRAMTGIIGKLGTPARLCQLRGKSPGRRVGQVVRRSERFKTVYKAAPPARTVV